MPHWVEDVTGEGRRERGVVAPRGPGPAVGSAAGGASKWGRTRNLSGAVAGAAADVGKNTGGGTSLPGFVGFPLIFFS